MRVALYSHDTMGLGHLRRNLLIADALSAAPAKASSLLITGAHEANFFRLPSHADLLTLPRWRKDAAGGYHSAQLSLSHQDLVTLRAESIRAALRAFAPDLLIVDKVPTGVFGELAPTLRTLASECGTRVVLGLRDVLDEPENVAEEWLCDANVSAIENHYDEVWVYGDRRVYDPVEAYSLPKSIASKVVFTGFIDQSARVRGGAEPTLKLLNTIAPDRPLVLCTVGGGQDGAKLALEFIRAFPDDGRVGVLVGGPFMPADQMRLLRQAADGRRRLHVFDFLPEVDLLVERAERVVSMAGYNTVCSLLSFQKRALLVPRVSPRREQWIRAKSLADLGHFDMIHPNELTTESLCSWLVSDLLAPIKPAAPVNLNGLEVIKRIASDASPSGSVSRHAAPATPVGLNGGQV